MEELYIDESNDGFVARLLQSLERSAKTTTQEYALDSYILEVKAAYHTLKKFGNYLLGIRLK